MSYILDALRRADAERQRGAVPGLHAPAGAGLPAEAAAAPGAPARRLGLLAAALALLGLAGAAGWLLRPTAGPGAPVSARPAPTVLPGPAAAMPPGLPMPPLPPLPPAVPAARPGLAGPAARSAQPLPAALPLQPGASAQRPALGSSSATAELAPAPAPVQPATAAAPARWPSLAELPEAQQREIGPLLVGGAMHAEQAALRIVILNGQVVHEGDKLGPELQVQQIRLKSVVLSLRGQRFELPL